jgi:hypothetical protein
MQDLKEFLPFLQTLLGGLMTLLGVYIVQRKSDSREKNKLYREVVQETYELLNKMETNYLNESILFYKGVRDKSLTKSDLSNDATTSSDRVIALLELYFPFMEELIEKLCEAEVELVNYHNDVIDSFKYVELKVFTDHSEKISDRLSESISNIKNVLVELMQDKRNF